MRNLFFLYTLSHFLLNLHNQSSSWGKVTPISSLRMVEQCVQDHVEAFCDEIKILLSMTTILFCSIHLSSLSYTHSSFHILSCKYSIMGKNHKNDFKTYLSVNVSKPAFMLDIIINENWVYPVPRVNLKKQCNTFYSS